MLFRQPPLPPRPSAPSSSPAVSNPAAPSASNATATSAAASRSLAPSCEGTSQASNNEDQNTSTFRTSEPAGKMPEREGMHGTAGMLIWGDGCFFGAKMDVPAALVLGLLLFPPAFVLCCRLLLLISELVPLSQSLLEGVASGAQPHKHI